MMVNQKESVLTEDQALLDATAEALAYAKQQGATAAEASIGDGNGLTVDVRKGALETVEREQNHSMSIRVFKGQHTGSASTTDLSSEAIKACADSALNIAKYTEADACNGLADAQLMATQFHDLDMDHPQPLEIQQATDIALACEQAGLEADARISNSEGSRMSVYRGREVYANSHGFAHLNQGTRFSLSCSLIAGAGDAMQRDAWYDSKVCFNDLDSAEEIGRLTAEKTVSRLNAQRLKTGKYPVIFDNKVSKSLVGHLISAISGSSLYRKASFLLDSQGQRLFPEFVNMRELPHLPRAAGSASYDNEGVATAERVLVEQGVLQGYVLSSYSARRLGFKTTANAGGVHNLTVSGTQDDLSALLKTMGTGVLVTELIGFSVNTVTGDYSRGAFGFWVENGEIQYAIEEFTVAGQLKDMFRNIVAIAKDVDVRGNIRCGSLLIDEMTVAGS